MDCAPTDEDERESRRARGGVGGEWRAESLSEKLDRDELQVDLDVREDSDEVEGRERSGSWGRVKVLLEEACSSLRSDTFLPQESSPNIAADFLAA